MAGFISLAKPGQYLSVNGLGGSPHRLFYRLSVWCAELVFFACLTFGVHTQQLSAAEHFARLHTPHTLQPLPCAAGADEEARR